MAALTAMIRKSMRMAPKRWSPRYIAPAHQDAAPIRACADKQVINPRATATPEALPSWLIDVVRRRRD
jgi:hypothetical protein